MTKTLADARAVAAAEQAEADAMHAEWEAQQEDLAIERYYADVSKADLIRMLATARNLKGKPHTAFEFQALCAAWYMAFGDLPPTDDYGSEAPDDGQLLRESAPITAPIDVPERLHSPKDVAALTGISVATLKRMVTDGRFPKPMRVSPRRIAWPAAEVRAQLARMDGKRRNVGRVH